VPLQLDYVRGGLREVCYRVKVAAVGVRILRTAIQAPRMNATCERLLGTLRCEFLGRMLILGEAHLRAVLIEYQVHDNTARPHQGIAQWVPGCEHEVPRGTGLVGNSSLRLSDGPAEDKRP